MRYLIIFLLLISSAKAQIPAGVFNQFSGVPLNKQVWFCFDEDNIYSDAGFFVNRIPLNGTPVAPIKAADGVTVFNDGAAQIEGSSSAGDMGNTPPNEINRKIAYLNPYNWFVSSVDFILNSPFTIYTFWGFYNNQGEALRYLEGEAMTPTVFTVPTWPYTGDYQVTSNIHVPLRNTSVGLVSYVKVDTPANTVVVSAFCLIID